MAFKKKYNKNKCAANYSDHSLNKMYYYFNLTTVFVVHCVKFESINSFVFCVPDKKIFLVDFPIFQHA